jgi:hypothetical protein
MYTAEDPTPHNVSLLQLADMISNKGYRPPIPSDCPSSWKSLIERCWDQNPANRPTFEEILVTLKEMKRNDPVFQKPHVDKEKKSSSSSEDLINLDATWIESNYSKPTLTENTSTEVNKNNDAQPRTTLRIANITSSTKRNINSDLSNQQKESTTQSIGYI